MQHHKISIGNKSSERAQKFMNKTFIAATETDEDDVEVKEETPPGHLYSSSSSNNIPGVIWNMARVICICFC